MNVFFLMWDFVGQLSINNIAVTIAYFGKQPLPFTFIGIIQWFPSEIGKKMIKIGKIKAMFGLGIGRNSAVK